MVLHELACFRQFHCIADRCPDTCCAGWEVDLDPDILKTYSCVPSPLGDEVRSHLQIADGYTFFRMEQGRCPFLNGNNLCRLILEGGEELLSVTCREHPRFVEEYGNLRETSLSISCPEAAGLLFSGSLEICTRETAEEAELDWGLDESLLHWLLSLRDALFGVVERGLPITELFSELLSIGKAAQTALDRWNSGPAPVISVFNIEYPLDLSGFFATMEKMEFTSDRLPKLLTDCTPLPDTIYNSISDPVVRVVGYFLYRYVLKSVWDERIYEKIAFSVYSAATIGQLSASHPEVRFQDAAILYSREVEHSDENLHLLMGYCGNAC